MVNANSINTNFNPSGAFRQLLQPTQSCFLAFASGTVANVTGDGTVYTAQYNSTQINQNNNYVTPSYSIPATGNYLFNITVRLSGLNTSLATLCTVILIAGVGTYELIRFNPSLVANESTFSGSIIIPLFIAQSAHVEITASGGTKTISWVANGAGQGAGFSGILVC